MGPEQLERNLWILFPGTVEEGGELGRKGVKLQWLTMSLTVSQHPSRPPFWELTPLPGRSPQAVTGLQAQQEISPALGTRPSPASQERTDLMRALPVSLQLEGVGTISFDQGNKLLSPTSSWTHLMTQTSPNQTGNR